eukprot:gb/GECH01012176.1/.p1 GENE.gb/GECH01012176.1/~~gb/GECH01012176.1/.p1  ORF type:complete len:144 (+),score=42.25 gb/GECH01012176.1/:1-432(+)
MVRKSSRSSSKKKSTKTTEVIKKPRPQESYHHYLETVKKHMVRKSRRKPTPFKSPRKIDPVEEWISTSANLATFHPPTTQGVFQSKQEYSTTKNNENQHPQQQEQEQQEHSQQQQKHTNSTNSHQVSRNSNPQVARVPQPSAV